MEAAAGLCVSQTNYNVEVEHLCLKLLESPDIDLQKILRYYEVDQSQVNRELTDAMSKFRRGSNRTPALSLHILQLLHESWVMSSLHFGEPKVRSGAILMALLEHEALRGMIIESAPSLTKISRDSLRQDIKELIRDSAENNSKEETGSGEQQLVSNAPVPDESEAKTGQQTKSPALDQYTLDLTERARNGLIDPVQGRDFEIRQIIDILMRKRQNNPILTGEAGVGKTAVVEGFALRLAKGDVPPVLKNVSLRLLDLGLLQAGAGVRGEFEGRLKSVITEVTRSLTPIILFVDEAHTLIGAGGTAGQGDAASLLKPALARGELRTIAATTWAEYKKYIEKDPALARRFQVIKVEEPEDLAAVDMLRATVAHLEKHHGVQILNEALCDAVKLSSRYISGRQLPDKAVSVLDTACARVAISQNDTPPAVEDALRRIELLDLEIKMLKREEATGTNNADRLKEMNEELAKAQKIKKKQQKKWQTELALVKQVQALQAEIQEKAAQKNPSSRELSELNKKLAELQAELENSQGPEPMVPVCVDSKVVASVVSGWTGVPVGKMVVDEIKTVLNLKEKLAERVIGQPKPLEAICRRVQTSRANLEDPGKPLGVFLLVGPSGVGKTETAIALADILYGGEKNLVRVNMSEYQEAHTVSNLKGAPPGYVGFGQGGVLTEAVRKKPYSVVLLDEVEKAHPDVMEMFYQVLDKGIMEDSEGVTINFKNTIILLTSNAGSDLILKEWEQNQRLSGGDGLEEKLRPDLLQIFKPAFLGRLVVVPYLPLGDKQLRKIVQLKLDKIQERFRANHRAELSFDGKLVDSLARRCQDVETGARTIDNILTHTLLPEIGTLLLEQMVDGAAGTGVHISLDSGGQLKYELRRK